MLFSRIPQIIAGAYGRANRAVENTCAKIQTRAMDRSRVASGEMRGGWQYNVEGQEGVVFNMVQHTIYNEYGTINMSAQPMLAPAVEETLPEFEAELAGTYR